MLPAVIFQSLFPFFLSFGYSLEDFFRWFSRCGLQCESVLKSKLLDVKYRYCNLVHSWHFSLGSHGTERGKVREGAGNDVVGFIDHYRNSRSTSMVWNAVFTFIQWPFSHQKTDYCEKSSERTNRLEWKRGWTTFWTSKSSELVRLWSRFFKGDLFV